MQKQLRAPSAFVHFFIRGLSWDAQASGLPFEDVVQIASKARLTDSPRGRVLAATAGTYTLPPLADLTDKDLHEVSVTLLRAIADAKASERDLSDDAVVSCLLRKFPAR